MRHGPATGRVDARPSHSPRRDIQGLRALAVGLVVVYHLRPDSLPGGFIGVDVFFVVSGFLIVGSLAREAAKRSTISIRAFYARRIRRLFPASAAVLVAVSVGAVLLLPQSRWQSISSDAFFSLLQVQNWHQALSAVSYAGATQAVSPLQHFWSLAVEEQFYLVVPFFIVMLVVAARRTTRGAERGPGPAPGRSPGRYIVPALAVIAATSFLYSVYLSNAEHTIAYFATTTRVWELAVGGLAALVPPFAKPSGRVASGITWVACAAIIVPAFFLTTDMPFPGAIAAVPVLGTALLLRVGPLSLSTPWSPSKLLSVRPIAFIGDVSYSLYLWHWPVVVFAVALLGRAPGIREAFGLGALSLLLAAASYRWIEQPFRRRSPRRPAENSAWIGYRSAFGLALALAACVAVTAWVPWQVVETKRAQLLVELSDRDYPGAQTWSTHPRAAPLGLPIRPDPSVAMQDVPASNAGACGVYDPATVPDTDCWFGSPAARGVPTIEVLGDSHAGQFVDPLIAISRTTPLTIHAMVRNGCPFALTPPRSTTTVYSNCSSQNAQTAAKVIEQKPGLVLVAGMRESSYQKALGWSWSPDASLVDGYVQSLSGLRAAGLRVAVMADLPYPHGNPVECVQRYGRGDECTTAASEAFEGGKDPLVAAARQVPGVDIIDLSRLFCRDGACPAVVGNVLVYRDNHMTNTFAKTLAPDLAVALGLSP
ncbi:acyltransferase family protein [Sinomonas sp. P47F7]|uniref:acyltransferase family protein n=1 Tax=Sinomonas sp. P47F7 TaxID=3410987 RepID=UPI003BF4AB24